jgi:cobalt/nickel transport system permease protein
MSLTVRDSSTPDSPLSRWDARWKLAAVAVAAAAVAVLRTAWPSAVALLLAVGLAVLGRVRWGVLGSRWLVLLFAVGPVLAVLPFTAENGWLTAVGVGLRAFAVGTLAVVLVHTAPLSRTFAAAHRLHVPGVLVQIAQLAHRYSLLFFAEARRVRVAMRTRGFKSGTNAHTYRTLGAAAGTLLVRGGDRAERVADAMRCRGFDGTYHAVTPFRTTVWDVIGFAGVVVAFGGLVLWEWVIGFPGPHPPSPSP